MKWVYVSLKIESREEVIVCVEVCLEDSCYRKEGIIKK